MQKTEIKLTVCFEDPFWIGIYESITDGQLIVCKITFGAEPKDYQVYDFLLQNRHWMQFSPPVKSDHTPNIKINPKRMQRAIKKQLERQSIGTKSQQALKLQYEENKIARKERNRSQKEDEKQRKFELRQHKLKQKHKGR